MQIHLSMFWNQQLLNALVSQMFPAVFPVMAWAFSLKTSSESKTTAGAKQEVNGLINWVTPISGNQWETDCIHSYHAIAEHKVKWKLCILEAKTTYVKIKITLYCDFFHDQ